MGMFGDIEAYKNGVLNNYILTQSEYGATIKLPWNSTGQNTCAECMDMTNII